MTNSLGLEDPDDLYGAVQEYLGLNIRFRAHDYPTVGHVYRALLAHFEGKGGGRCATAMAFFRLRRALRGRRATGLVPSCDLKKFTRQPPRALLRLLERRTGLRMPTAGVGTMRGVGLLVMTAALIFGFSFADYGPQYPRIAVAAFVLGGIVAAMGSSAFPKNCETLGGLAGQVAVLNFAKLVEQGAHAGPREVWTVLVEIAAMVSLKPRDKIGPDTFVGDPESPLFQRY